MHSSFGEMEKKPRLATALSLRQSTKICKFPCFFDVIIIKATHSDCAGSIIFGISILSISIFSDSNFFGPVQYVSVHRFCHCFQEFDAVLCDEASFKMSVSHGNKIFYGRATSSENSVITNMQNMITFCQ